VVVQLELRRVSPLRAANIVAILYAVSMLIVAIPMFAVFSLLPEASTVDPQKQQLAWSTFRWILLAYPVFGLIFGWFGGLIGSCLYNAIAGTLGGFQLEYLSTGNPSQSPVA
jgi:hypothetical protein